MLRQIIVVLQQRRDCFVRIHQIINMLVKLVGSDLEILHAVLVYHLEHLLHLPQLLFGFNSWLVFDDLLLEGAVSLISQLGIKLHSIIGDWILLVEVGHTFAGIPCS